MNNPETCADLNREKIFADLHTDDVIKLEDYFQSLFITMDSVAVKKATLQNAGIDHHFIGSLEFNLETNQFVTVLVSKLKDYPVSCINPSHPLIKIAYYLINKKQSEPNFNEEKIEILRKIHSIGLKKIESFSRRKNYKNLLIQERQQQTATCFPRRYEEEIYQIDHKIITRYEFKELEDAIKEELGYNGVFAFTVSCRETNVLRDYIIPRILYNFEHTTKRKNYIQEHYIYDSGESLLKDIERELKEKEIGHNIVDLVSNNPESNIVIIIWNYHNETLIIKNKIYRFYEEIENNCLNSLNEKMQCLIIILADNYLACDVNGFRIIKTPEQFILDGRQGLLQWFRNELHQKKVGEHRIEKCIERLQRLNGNFIATCQLLQTIIKELNGKY